MQFPKRYEVARCPAYPELEFKVLANPDGATHEDLLWGDGSEEGRKRLGPALVVAYAGGIYEGYGVTLDFSTAEKAMSVVEDQTLPVDLIRWIRNAPIDIVTHEREQMRGNLATSFGRGN